MDKETLKNLKKGYLLKRLSDNQLYEIKDITYFEDIKDMLLFHFSGFTVTSKVMQGFFENSNSKFLLYGTP